jgi:HSP20 family molecular chaperone IbpA
MIFDEFETIPSFLKNMTRAIDSVRPGQDMLVFEVPGFTKEDLSITIEGLIMRIKGKKELYGRKYEIDQKMILTSEYLDSSSPITAKVEDGLLCINLKKSEKSKQTKVNIS